REAGVRRLDAPEDHLLELVLPGAGRGVALQPVALLEGRPRVARGKLVPLGALLLGQEIRLGRGGPVLRVSGLPEEDQTDADEERNEAAPSPFDRTSHAAILPPARSASARLEAALSLSWPAPSRAAAARARPCPASSRRP